MVNKAGNLIDLFIAASVEYSMDEEALRIIRDSGEWEPAFQNGRNVKSYKMQPINFRLQ
jgi:periplasmic protein TonB